VTVSVPVGWTEIAPQCCDFRQFGGETPRGHLSIGHESPYTSSVCDPECHAVDVPQTIPYDATKQVASLRAAVAEIAGTDDWTPLPAETVTGLVDGAIIETTGTGPDGAPWRRVYITGIKARNLVTFAFSQPVDIFDQGVLDEILASLDLGEAPQYSDGDPIPADQGPFSMDVPGSWITPAQPELDGTLLSGVWRFGDGEVLVSLGTADGTLGWCDPDCVRLTGMTSLHALEAAIRADRPFAASTEATLDGEPALLFGTDSPHQQWYIVAIHGGRPVALRVDAGEWDVAPGIPEQLFDSFRFVDPGPASTDQVLVDPGGRFEVSLAGAWSQRSRDDGLFIADLDQDRLTVRVGDDDGRITRCETPANVWEACGEVTVTSLEELAAAVAPIIGEPGLSTPSFRRDESTLDGERSVVYRIQGYEPEAQGGQWIIYVVAMHDGRPYILRFWSGQDFVAPRGVDEAIAGFRFTD
jgi:hypothetical protein